MNEDPLVAGEQPDTAPTQQEPDSTEPAQSATPPEAGETAAPEVPAEYEPFALPDGLTADEEILAEFKATAKELKLPQKEAQKFADLGAKIIQKQQAEVVRVRSEWLDQSRTDKEFGGEHFKENLGVAKKAIDAFATPQLRAMLDSTGLGNHPEVIRHFIRVGKAISEDGRVVTGGASKGPADPAKRMFPNQQ